MLSNMWYFTGTLSKQVSSCVQVREMEVLREFTLVMTGGLGVAACVSKDKKRLYTLSLYIDVRPILFNTKYNCMQTYILYTNVHALTHNMNVYLLSTLIELVVSQLQETAISLNCVYRESVSDSHSQFSCCIVDHLLAVGSSIRSYYRSINPPARRWYQVPPWSCHLRVPAGHLKLVFVACSTTRHGGGDVHLGRGCRGKAVD